jgi:septum formation protein
MDKKHVGNVRAHSCAPLQLILASSSPRRRQLLKKLGIPFRVMPSHVPEDSTHKNPIRLVQDLALRKAREIASRLKEGIVLGADTVVVLRGHIMSKPCDTQDACRMLGSLSGTTHRVYTGVALVDAASGKQVVSYARSDVRMKKIALHDLRRLSGRHLDKAGSYAIQEKKDPIARVVKGSYDNVVGLPVGTVKKMLAKF